MGEAFKLAGNLPISYKTESEATYIAFLWDAFQPNYETGKFEFSGFAYHLLYMSFVSFSLWQIRIVRERDFTNALIGFQLESETTLLAAESPFKFYDKLKESQVFRFLKILGCANDQVGEFAKFVKRRNKIAHPTGTVFFNDKRSIDSEILLMMSEVANIQKHMSPIVTDIYKRFLTESADVEEREYSDSEAEIEANLYHRYYVSSKDIEMCLAFDINCLSDRSDFQNIRELHGAVRLKYESAGGQTSALRNPIAE